jgi:glycosyltransferase involved in cell wall biosynthesis
VSTDLRFSVVIPTRDRPRALARCLEALERQHADGAWEIVVVDDGSTRDQEVAAAAGASARSRLVRTAPRGSVHARNVGIREARAPVVLLIDDDCEPRPAWATSLATRVEGGAAAAAGRCLNPEPADALADATQLILDHLTLRSVRRDGTTSFAPTYNLACSREVALSVPFDESYVNQGADRDWCARLVQRGLAIAFEPEAVVDHRQQLGLRSFWSKHRAYGAGSARFHRRQGTRLERPGFYVQLLRAGFRRGPRTGSALLLAQLATAVGFAGHAIARDARAAARPADRRLRHRRARIRLPRRR